MPELSHLHGILDAMRIAAVGTLLADVCKEEHVGKDDLDIRKTVAEAVLAAIGRGEIRDIEAIKSAARTAIGRERARLAALARARG